jgi:aerobic C4-dicarboxylate transport protein
LVSFFSTFDAMNRIFTNLTFWVLLAIAAGIALGHFAPKIALHQILQDDWKAHFMGQELKLGKSLSEAISGLFISIVSYLSIQSFS